MTDEVVLSATDGRGVATLTLNRPERGNAYNAAVLHGLLSELHRLEADSTVRVLVLRAKGKHFCVGADLAAPAASGDAPAAAAAPGLTEVCLALDTLSKPTVALVQGACIGGGVAFAACCDVVIAAHAATFSIPEVRIGFAPTPLAPFFLRAMGARQLRHYGLTGERFGAAEAHRIGLVHHLAEPADDAALQPHIESLLLGAPGAQAGFKQALARIEHEVPGTTLLQSLQQRFNELRGSPEALEGKAAFAEKRKPRWYPPPKKETPSETP